jgi:hypothetical protein
MSYFLGLPLPLGKGMPFVIYFNSQDFLDLCKRNKIDGSAISHSIKELVDFPIISRKKIANDIARVIDKFFVREKVGK